MATERMNLTPALARLLAWVRDNPHHQAAEIPGRANLRTAEKMCLVWWSGSRPVTGGWCITSAGMQQLALNQEPS